MDVYHLRHTRLMALVAKHGKAVHLAEAMMAAGLKMNEQRISQLLGNKNPSKRKNMGGKAARQFEKFAGDPAGSWDIPMDYIGSNVEEAASNYFLDPGQYSLAPVVGRVKGGPYGYLEEEPMAVGDGELRVPYRGRDPNAFGLRVIGDSMSPRYNHGEYIVACPNLPYAPGKYVFVSLVDGSKLLKKLGIETEDSFELLSVNNGYKPMTVLKEEIERICVVQGPFDPDDIHQR